MARVLNLFSLLGVMVSKLSLSAAANSYPGHSIISQSRPLLDLGREDREESKVCLATFVCLDREALAARL